MAPTLHQLPIVERRYGVSVLFSDDGGETWLPGGAIPLGEEQLNESRIAELSDGRIIVNARSGPFTASRRFLSVSEDGGINWSKPQEITSLPIAFATDAGMTRVKDRNGNYLLVMSAPANRDRREDLTAYTSEDGGITWSRRRTIYSGAAHYSDVVTLPENDIGIVYGRDTLDPSGDIEGNVRSVVFSRFGLNWLYHDEKRG